MGLDGFMAGCLSAIYSSQARVRRGFVVSGLRVASFPLF